MSKFTMKKDDQQRRIRQEMNILRTIADVKSMQPGHITQSLMLYIYESRRTVSDKCI